MNCSVQTTLSKTLMLFPVSTHLVKYDWSVSLLVEPVWPRVWKEACEAGGISFFPSPPQCWLDSARGCVHAKSQQWDSPTELLFSRHSQWAFTCNWTWTSCWMSMSGHLQNQVLSNREEAETCYDFSLGAWMFVCKALRLMTFPSFNDLPRVWMQMTP